MVKTRPPVKKKRIHASGTPTPPADPPLLRCGMFTLDQRTLRATKGECQLILNPMQTRLFLLFMRHAGRVIRHKTIMKEIWKTDFTKDLRMLYVHIWGLRKKIEDDPRHPAYLRTVRGIGYRFGMPGEDTSPAI
jgi:DNA-binding response OmpR family regulator